MPEWAEILDFAAEVHSAPMTPSREISCMYCGEKNTTEEKHFFQCNTCKHVNRLPK